MLHFIYINLIWLISGFLTGITSFGSNLFAVPLITLIMSPRDSIVLGSMVSSAIFLALFIIYIRHVFWLESLLLTLSAFCGIPLGIWFLLNSGPKSLLLASGFSLLLFLLWQVISHIIQKNKKPLNSCWAIPVGILSGIMMGAVSFGGPPLALYAFLRQWNKDQTLGSINAVSFGIMLINLPWLWQKGLFIGELPTFGLYSSISAILGIIISIPITRKINSNFFRILLLIMIAISAAMLIWRGTTS